MNHQQKLMNSHDFNEYRAPEPRCAADTAGAVRGLGAISPAKRAGLLTTRQCASFSLS